MSEDDASEEAQEENEDRPEQTTEELIAKQHIVNVAPLEKNYRFYLVDETPAFAVEDTKILQDNADDAAEAGTLAKDSIVYILEELDDGWDYVESGEVRGFIRSDKLTDDAATREIIDGLKAKAGKATITESRRVVAEDYYVTAEPTVSEHDNAAYLYSLATVYDRVVDKEYAVIKGKKVSVLEEEKGGSEKAGILHSGDVAYILACENGWAFIESGDVRGFVREDALYTGQQAEDAVNQAGGDEKMSTAEQLVSPEDNEAFYFTYTSIKEGTAENPIRKALLKTAQECVGNPYVWGGTSLTSGCDCSGFVQTLFGLYGISLPRTAEAQSQSGTQIPVSEAEPGDLIFFAKDGYVYHVALYTGDNTTIEAYDESRGIINNTLDTTHAVWAVRVLDN